ncbi:TolB family protein [Nocardioides jishulii]|uniref:Bacterial Ig-like domain-containing protein n=1 Tax=Nocardioides jishulii TaxID=2575440 RepID=A0A4U2YSH1_9ACTN|nr:Ig-like domain repeat protein [Nocardioides jishulii]QCX28715.1 hypothetical protein FCL41_15130 [Nocardioides jishulii]TKI64389.1 hypothetical protein FC770_04440 [Nocardioides jishulii]
MNSRASRVSVVVVGVLLAALVAVSGPAQAADPSPVQVVPPAGVALGGYPSGLDMSADGRWVAYTGSAGATFGLYVADRTTGVTTPLFTGATPVGELSISADGDRIAYVLGTGTYGVGPTVQVRVFDRPSGTSRPVSATADGVPGDGHSFSPDISEDGTAVAFSTYSTNLADGTGGEGSDVLVKEIATGEVERISGAGAATESGSPVNSADGDRVAFVTDQDLVSGDTDVTDDVVVRTRSTGALALVSRAAGGAAASEPAISADGRKVAYLVAEGGSPELPHSGVFVTTVAAGATVRASTDDSGEMRSPSQTPELSSDGRFVLFTAMTSGPGRLAVEVFVRDVARGTTTWVSTAHPGSAFGVSGAAISGTGRHVLFAALSVDGTTAWTADLGEPVAPPVPVNTALPAQARAKVAKGPSYSFVAKAGTWEDADGFTPTYQWLRNGRPIPGAKARTYVVTPADFGKRIAVRETLTPVVGEPVSAVSAATKAVKPGSDLTAKVARSRVKAGAPVVVTVRVRHDFGVRPQGKVQVSGGKRSKAVKVDADGRMTVRLKGLGVGRHTVRVSYAGTPHVKRAETVRIQVRITRR